MSNFGNASLHVRPQPGAVKGELVANGLPLGAVTNPEDPSWPELPASEAPNFVTAMPRLFSLPAGPGQDHLFRVWGEPAFDVGRYWTCAEPMTQDAFYGGAAVEYQWNSGRYLAELVNAGSATSIKTWVGPAARQPAMGGGDHGRAIVTLADYHLEGGTMQVYIPGNQLPYLQDRHTRWNPAATHAPGVPAVAEAPTLETLPPAALPRAVDTASYNRLIAGAQVLSQLLRSLDVQVSALGARLGTMAGLLTSQAKLLEEQVRALNAQLRQSATDPAARSRARAIAWSLVATGRHVDGDFSWSEKSSQVDKAVQDIVVAAYGIANALN